MAERFSPEWNLARAQFFEELARKQRGLGIEWADEQRRKSHLAYAFAQLKPGDIGYEQAQEAYERG